VEVPHCRAKVKVRVRTGGENRTAPETGARAAHDCSCWGWSFRKRGKGLSYELPVFLEGQKMKKMKLAALLLVIGALGAKAQLVESFSDIQFWTGSGENRSALVLQWNDGGTPASLAWGYRWSGNATGVGMLKAIAGQTTVSPAGDPGTVLETSSGADARMTLSIERYGFGDAIYAMSFHDGITTRSRADWASGYWAYDIFGGNFDYTNYGDPTVLTYSTPGSVSYSSVTWFSSPIGASDRELVDGSWDAFHFAPSFVTSAVLQPDAVSVPEPSVVVLVAMALVFFMLRRRVNE